MAKEKVRRAIDVHFLDGSVETLDLSRVTSLNMNGPAMIHFDQMGDGTWRLTYTDPLFDKGLREVDRIVIVRK